MSGDGLGAIEGIDTVDRDRATLSPAKRALLEHRLRSRETAGARPPVGRRGGSGPTPLSAAQEQVWLQSQLAAETPLYNEVVTIRKDGPFDVDAFARAFNELVRRHDSWHSTFQVIDGAPMQVPHRDDGRRYDLPLSDLRDLPPDEREHHAAMQAVEDSRPPYDLEHGPLLRPRLVRLSDDHHRLYLSMHHIVFDGVSLYRVILPELISLYNAYAGGQDSTLADPPVEYADYAVWEHDTADTAEDNRRLEYWRKRLSTAPPLQLPLDRPRPSRQRFRGSVERLHIPKEVVDGLRKVGQQTGASLFQVIAAAYAVFLRVYAAQDDVVFGTAADMRRRPELEQMVGYCLTPLVLRVDMSDDPSFLELVSRTRRELLDGLDNLVPFGRLVRELQPPRDPSINPLFQVMLMLEPLVASSDPSWSLHLMEAEMGGALGHAKFDLSVDLDERPAGDIDGRLTYNTDVFESESADGMACHWRMLLEAVIASPTSSLSQLPMVSEQERRQQLVKWNDTDVPYGTHACLHELIAEQAQRTPAVAVSDDHNSITFAELDERAGRMASQLRELGVGPDDLVGVCMQRSIDLVVALLGILKAGGAFVPLDPDQPQERLAFMLEQTHPKVVLTTAHDRQTVPATTAQVLAVDADRARWLSHPPYVATDCRPENLAYVLYTSGSTGEPKGVMIEHRSLVNQLSWMVDSFALTGADRIMHKTPLSFDPALWELFAPLLSGASLTILRPGDHADPVRLVRAVREAGITVLSFVPSMLDEFIAADDSDQVMTLRLVTSGGEVTTPALAGSFVARFGAQVELRNMYGPTEAVITASWWRCGALSESGSIPIGRPVANTTLYVLGPQLTMVPTGAPGELCIGGVQVARGYLNRPDLTAVQFVPNPFAAGETIYRSGDMARFRHDGAIEFLGRRDRQVKIRGVRIELGEIEAAITRHPGVRQAVAALRIDPEGLERLVAYIRPAAPETNPTLAELRAFLWRTLPVNMVPTALVVVDSIPLTHNGKIAQDLLPDPGWRPNSTFRAPQSALEKRMAALWARTLHMERVGLDDDFFELGGHSLLAVRLLVRVEREFGPALPLTTFFEGAASVAGLSAAVERSRADAQDGSSSHPSAGTADVAATTRPILFFVQPGESAFLTLRHFTRALGPEQRVVGLLPERKGARFDQSRTIEELAAGILGKIRAAQPSGPYYVAGFSMGGLLAYEIATQMRAAGDEVAWLGLLDAASPASSRRAMRRRLSLSQRLARQRERGLAGSLQHTAEVAAREVTAALVRLRLRESRLGDDFDWRGAMKLASLYRSVGNDAPMELFLTAEGVAESGSPSLGWASVHKGSLHTHAIPGGHISMVKEPYVSEVAARLAQSLRRAHAENGVT